MKAEGQRLARKAKADPDVAVILSIENKAACRKALLNIQIDLRNASVTPVAGEDAVLCTDIDAVIEAAIKELS